MTNDEAIKKLKAKLECMNRQTRGIFEECNSDLCEDCDLNYDKGNMGEQKETLRMAIKALEQEPILDKIRAEMEELIEWHDCPIELDGGNDAWYCEAVKRCMEIIDKYRQEG